MLNNQPHKFVCYCDSLETYFNHVKENDRNLHRHLPPIPGLEYTSQLISLTDDEINVEATRGYALLKAMKESMMELESLTWGDPVDNRKNELMVEKEKKSGGLSEATGEEEVGETTLDVAVSTLPEPKVSRNLEMTMNTKRKKKLKWTQLVSVSGRK